MRRTSSAVLLNEGPFCYDEFSPGEHVKEFLESMKVLVIGAGGLGCEMLKNLALCGFKDIHVIDMDTIDLSNLNRQFLFRERDVGRAKAVVAAEFIMKRVAGVKVTPYFGKIQDHDDDFYMQFSIVICGLDSVEARRWINAKLVDLVDPNNPESLKPLIDGGTEGFKGQARVILPTVTSCYECSLDMLGKQVTYPICTIANTPRLPEHCIEWASVLAWPRKRPNETVDTDNPDHIQWIYEKASRRAIEFDIVGVTYSLTQGIVKNIIPAIASTNAIVAAACCNEAFKIATSCNPYLNNYMMYTGNESVYTYTFEHQKRSDCPVCGSESKPIHYKTKPSLTLGELIDELGQEPEINSRKISLQSSTKLLYMRMPPQLEENTRKNLNLTLEELGLEDGEELALTDPNLLFNLRVAIHFE